jgi:hypothetical protein
MKKEFFIKELESMDYIYHMDGDRIIITEGNPTSDGADIELTVITSNVTFENKGNVKLNWSSLPDGLEFRNGGSVFLTADEPFPPGTKFYNRFGIRCKRCNSIPSGVEFKNGTSVYFKDFDTHTADAFQICNLIKPIRVLNIISKRL